MPTRTAVQDTVTQLVLPLETREYKNADPQKDKHNDLEMIVHTPPTEGTQNKKKQITPIIYRNCLAHEDTPRRPHVRDRLGPRNQYSAKSRLGLPHTHEWPMFDKSRLGPRNKTHREKKIPWKNCVRSSPWAAWKPDMIPRCAESNREIWQPKCDTEWKWK